MPAPAWLPRLRAQVEAMRVSGDPIDRIDDGYEVHLRPDQMHVWDEGAAWCRANLDHGREQWSRRVYTGPDRDELPPAPVFAFSDATTAAAFKIVFY